MIVKMSKVTILVSKTSIDSALHDLRELGVVHVSHLKKPHADYIDTVKKRVSRIDKVLTFLGESKKQKKLSKEELVAIPKEIIGLLEEKNKIKENLVELKAKTVWFSQWGDISKKDIQRLADKGVFINLYSCSQKEFKKVKENNLIFVLGQMGPNLQVVDIARDKNKDLGFKRVEVPKESLQSLKEKINYLEESKNEIEEQIRSYSVYKHCFKEYKNKLINKFEFIKVKFGMAESKNLSWLLGFCPKASVENLKEMAKEKGWGIVVQKPDNPQKVPTLLKNPKWVEIIKPIFNFMGTLPGYKEYDISFWFLMFFSLFFAMLIGDAGYGFIFLILTYLARKKFKKAPAAPFFLIYVLAISTIIWGALSGTWFGAENIAQLPVFKLLVINKINSFVQANQSFMIYFCFIIGVVHLSVAHLIKAFRYLNSLKALAEIGWVCILWAAFFVAGKLVLNNPIPDFSLILGTVGITAVILFSNWQKNILKGALSSLGTLPLDIISSFSDIVSYLRLFAVGYATVAVASTFNTMALGAGSGILGGFLAAIILFFGHGLNILLGLMSVIVHGVRLNMLEFSGQLGMEWSGKKYQPFK
ncbi:MAG: hypothetical protein K9L84_01270 [Candidatus Omnitrophica bacterium]|nr:hypothetical protein [Candidatus Omnitrophota bacterium]MCF7893680.1 hypothetical protein [Candidatus Omnitrophota bacterium]